MPDDKGLPNPNTTLTAVAGIQVGHWTDLEARTGCTVVLCPPEGCIASGYALGGGPGTRELALLEPEKSVERVHAVLLTGGSAFGLDAASGVMRWLEEQGRGLSTPFGFVPIVPAAVIFDLGVGRADVRPDAGAGYQAASAASSAAVATGSVGVGAGATVGKLAGPGAAVAGGLGSAVKKVEGATVAALAVSNAVGSIFDPVDGSLVAGHEEDHVAPVPYTNTTLALVVTDAPLSKARARQLAQSAHIGIAQVTRPSHTPFDGDTTFALSTGKGPEVPLVRLSIAVQQVVAEAILQGVRAVQVTKG